MLVHFGLLPRAVPRPHPRPDADGAVAAPGKPVAVMRVRPSVRELAIPWAAFAVLVLLYGGGYLARQTPKAKLDLSEVARLPVVEGGRVKPLDTVARVNLRLLSHSEQFARHQRQAPPGDPVVPGHGDLHGHRLGRRPDYDVFRVENDQVANCSG